MKNTARLRIAALALAACLLCPLAPPAAAVSMELSPLEDDGGYMKEYYLTDADLTLKLPVSAQLETMLDYIDQKGVGIYLPEYPDAYFAF